MRTGPSGRFGPVSRYGLTAVAAPGDASMSASSEASTLRGRTITGHRALGRNSLRLEFGPGLFEPVGGVDDEVLILPNEVETDVRRRGRGDDERRSREARGREAEVDRAPSDVIGYPTMIGLLVRRS